MSDQAAAIAKVAKLIPSLSRENDHEVVTTVRLMDRALRSGGLDFHDLAKVVEGRVVKGPEAPRSTYDPNEIVPRSHSVVLCNAIRRKRHFLNSDNKAKFDRLDAECTALARSLRRADHNFLQELAKTLNV